MAKRNKISLLIAIISTVIIRESQAQACFRENETHRSGAKRGDNFYRECICKELNSSKNLKWFDPHNREIPLGPEIGALVYSEWNDQNGISLSLYIQKLNKSLAGAYKCVSQGTDGELYSITYDVEVYQPLYFVETNLTQYLITGTNSMLYCSTGNETKPHISWYKGQNTNEITNDEKYEILPNGLLIKNASMEDAGEYKCYATDINTSDAIEIKITAEVMTAPTILDIIADNTDVVENDSVILECKADGFPLPAFTWRKINQTGSEDINETRYEQEMNKLTFENISMDDDGIYECIANNNAGEARQNITLGVKSPPKIISFENATVVEGSIVNIICEANGRPTPYLNIDHFGQSDRQPISNKTIDEPTKAVFNLTFESVDRSLEGWYDCIANNSVGFDVQSLYLTVLYKPFFENSKETVYAWEGKSVNLSCEHESLPPALLEWKYFGTFSSKHTPEELEIYQLWQAKLSRTIEDHLPFMPVKKMFYGIYECTAKNELGQATKTIYVKEGFRPPILELINITSIAATSAIFEFDVESLKTVGPPVIGITAEYDEKENYNITDIHKNRTWAFGITYKIEKLKPNTQYYVRFYAINEMGNGPFGGYYEFETPEKSIPEPVTLVDESAHQVIPADNMILKLRPSENNGDPIDYFAIKYCPMDSTTDCIEQIVPPTTELNLNHLNHNTSYIMEMVAHNSVGNSTPTNLQITIEDDPSEESLISAGGIIGVSIVVVVLAIVLLDLLLFVTKKQGMIANCTYKKNKKKDKENLQSKDKKGLLKDNGESGDTLKRPDNGHKEFEYNKTTGIITGKHSAV